MKKWVAFVLALVCVLCLAGCGRTMNDIIENEPSVTGIVKEVRAQSMLISIGTDGAPDGAACSVSLDVENPDSYTEVSVGDEVVVYYNGQMAEGDPLQINTVYAITLKTPADRTGNNKD